MKLIKIISLTILIAVALNACKHTDSDSMFASTRPSINGKYFETDKGASLYAAAYEDIAVDTQAYSLTMQGEISFLDTSQVDIVEYGHVWSTEANPMYDAAHVTIHSGNPGKSSFTTTISGLKMLTVYYVRSYIKLSDGEIGYNPDVTKIQTVTDENLWLSRPQFSGASRKGAFSFTINNIAYIGGGDIGLAYARDLWSYDPSKMSWTQGAAIDAARAYAVAFSINDQAFVGLGENLNGRLSDFYEFAGNSWKVINSTDNPFPGGKRTKAVAFAIDKFGYVGTGDAGTVVGDFLRFDLDAYNSGSDKIWSSTLVGSLGAPRKSAVCFVISKIAYVATGIDENGKYLNDIWEYMPERRSWRSISSSFPGTPRANSFAFGLYKDYLQHGEGYIGGGSNDTAIFSDVYMYVPEDNMWTQRADFLGGTIEGACGFSLSYQRENESFPTTKGFVVTGYSGTKLVNTLFEFLP